MRVAVEIADVDLMVLDTYRRLETELRPGESQIAAWFNLPGKLGLPDDVVESVGAKLHSFGLVRASSNLSGNRSSYALLQKGRHFMEFIKSHTESTQ